MNQKFGISSNQLGELRKFKSRLREQRYANMSTFRNVMITYGAHRFEGVVLVFESVVTLVPCDVNDNGHCITFAQIISRQLNPNGTVTLLRLPNVPAVTIQFPSSDSRDSFLSSIDPLSTDSGGSSEGSSDSS